MPWQSSSYFGQRSLFQHSDWWMHICRLLTFARSTCSSQLFWKSSFQQNSNVSCRIWCILPNLCRWVWVLSGTQSYWSNWTWKMTQTQTVPKEQPSYTSPSKIFCGPFYLYYLKPKLILVSNIQFNHNLVNI